jgi:hypothetical protein
LQISRVLELVQEHKAVGSAQRGQDERVHRYTHASGSAQRDAVNLLEEQLFPNWRVVEVSRKRKVS